MASIVRRGTRDNPRFFAKWVITDEGGKKKQRWRLIPGVLTLKDARAKLPEIEGKVAAGVREPLAQPLEPSAAGKLLIEWAGTGEPILDEKGQPKRDERGAILRDVGTLTNRNAASDRTIVNRHLVPRFGRMPLEAITLKEVMTWLREMQAAKKLSGQTQRHAMATLSRFWGWCVLWEKTTLPNPVKSIPPAVKPVVVHKERATLEDDATVAKLIANLPPPVDLMFALANRTGARLGEICGLRMGDLDDLGKGFIRVAHSYAGPLKEDRRGEGKVKKVPAPVDAAEMLKLHLARRRLEGAKADDPVFLPTNTRRRRKTTWTGFQREPVYKFWVAACEAVGLVDAKGNPTVGWYGASRTAQATRAAKADVSLEQVADSLGHADPALTKKHYTRFQREDFDPRLRLPMGPLLHAKKG